MSIPLTEFTKPVCNFTDRTGGLLSKGRCGRSDTFSISNVGELEAAQWCGRRAETNLYRRVKSL